MQALVNEYRVQGYHPTCVSGYRKRKAPAFALLGFRDKRRIVERIGLHLTEREYAERLAAEAKQGYMPSMVCGYADETNAVHFTALFIPAGGVVCKPQHDLTAAQYDQAMKAADAQGLRPISISVYPTAKGLRYAAI